MDSDSDEHDITAVERGEYLVIEGTDVAFDDSTNQIIGIVKKRKNKWVLVVPREPTADMLIMSDTYSLGLPKKYKK
jgi:formylmethanofuran dehydrogenase subunit D